LARCPTCGKEFSTEASLLQHVKDAHGTAAAGRQGEAPQKQASSGKQKPRSLRKRNRHPFLWGLVLVVVIGGAGLYYVIAPQFSQPFPCITGENYIHVHPYLRIIINGQNVTVPAAIGIQNPVFQNGDAVTGACLEPMHTHDSSGIIHVELAPTDAARNFTLSDFFKIWAWQPGHLLFNGTSHPIVFTPTDILGYQADSRHKVVMLVDGKPSTAFGSLPLERYDYCYSGNSNVPPCSPTAGGNPLWDGGSSYPYGTGHTIVIEYSSA